MGISVLMSIYHGTAADEFSSCLQSIDEQTLLPSQLVIVIDGPILNTVNELLSSLKESKLYTVEILEYAENRGLGAALADGLLSCDQEFVARVDTDDISLPHRFEIQHQHLIEFPDTSVVGGLLQEQNLDGDRTLSLTRPIPLGPDEINSKSRYRNPLDHPTVMFRRKDILEVGSYQPFLGFEDYFLWARLIKSGYTIENLNIVLVKTDVDDNYFKRRGGFQYLKHEIALAKKFYNIGFHNIIQSSIFLSTRIMVRLLPNWLRRWGYARFLRKNSRYHSDS